MTLARRSARPMLALVLVAALAACGSARRVAGASIPECVRCHGAPPATGAHLVHANPVSVSNVRYGDLHVLEDVAPAGANPASYDFGCGNCHPLDVAAHLGHVNVTTGPRAPDVVLDPAGAPSTSLRARNGALARYDAATRTCSDVYCHSSGQDPLALTSVSYRTTPAWDGPSGTLGCDGCHGNPPRYPSGGAGASDANSHLGLDEWGADFGWESGHFAGLPGPDHTSKHGNGDPVSWGTTTRASPITCQACHFETVDPANVRPGGFFYYDASGDYDLRPAGDPSRGSITSWQAAQCATCHAAGPGAGRVLPLRHVNGKRDVAFDRRTALPPGYDAGLPALATADPVRPYYMTLASPPQTTTTFHLDPGVCATTQLPSCGVLADVVIRDTLAGGRVLTMTLEHAEYDATTKTCSSVACHLERQLQLDTVGEAPVQQPLRWGTPYGTWGSATCTGCHLR